MLLELPGGHVGAVVSRSAQKSLWPKMSAFWAARDADVKMRIEAKPEAAPQVRANGHADPVPGQSAPAPISTPRVAAKKAARSKASSRSGGR